MEEEINGIIPDNIEGIKKAIEYYLPRKQYLSKEELKHLENLINYYENMKEEVKDILESGEIL